MYWRVCEASYLYQFEAAISMKLKFIIRVLFILLNMKNIHNLLLCSKDEKHKNYSMKIYSKLFSIFLEFTFNMTKNIEITVRIVNAFFY